MWDLHCRSTIGQRSTMYWSTASVPMSQTTVIYQVQDHDHPNAVSLIFRRPRDDDNDGDDDDDDDDGDKREIRMMRRMRMMRMLPAERAARMAATAVMMRKR